MASNGPNVLPIVLYLHVKLGCHLISVKTIKTEIRNTSKIYSIMNIINIKTTMVHIKKLPSISALINFFNKLVYLNLLGVNKM